MAMGGATLAQGDVILGLVERRAVGGDAKSADSAATQRTLIYNTEGAGGGTQDTGESPRDRDYVGCMTPQGDPTAGGASASDAGRGDVIEVDVGQQISCSCRRHRHWGLHHTFPCEASDL